MDYKSVGLRGDHRTTPDLVAVAKSPDTHRAKHRSREHLGRTPLRLSALSVPPYIQFRSVKCGRVRNQ